MGCRGSRREEDSHEILDPTLTRGAVLRRCSQYPCFIPGVQLGIRGWYPNPVGFPDRFANCFRLLFVRPRLLREKHFDVVYATHPTRTALLTGWPWPFRRSTFGVRPTRSMAWGTHRKYFSSLWGSRLYFLLFHRLERVVMRRAARIL